MYENPSVLNMGDFQLRIPTVASYLDAINTQ